MSLRMASAQWVTIALAIAVVAAVTRVSAAHRVQVLTDQNFEKKTGSGKWLVKFHAPWCGHCKRLAPVLDEVARNHFKDAINIGQVDCTVHTGLKQKFGIKGFPTLEYFEDGEKSVPFSGGRDVASIAAFGARMASPNIRPFNDPQQLLSWLNKKSPERDPALEPVSFLLLQGAAADPSAALATVVKESRGVTLFANGIGSSIRNIFCGGAANPPAFCEDDSTSTVLLRFESGEGVRAYPGSLQDEDELRKWVLSQRVPVFAEAGLHNFGVLTSIPRKKVVFVAFNPQDRSARALDFINRAANLARGTDLDYKDLTESFVFAKIDGVRWAGFMEGYNVEKTALPRTVVVDFETNAFWENRTTDQLQIDGIEPDSVAQMLQAIATGELVATAAGGYAAYIRQLWRVFKGGLPWSAVGVIVIGVVAVMLIWLLCSADDYDDEFYNENPADVPSVADAAKGDTAKVSKKKAEGKKDK